MIFFVVAATVAATLNLLAMLVAIAVFMWKASASDDLLMLTALNGANASLFMLAVLAYLWKRA